MEAEAGWSINLALDDGHGRVAPHLVEEGVDGLQGSHPLTEHNTAPQESD